MIKEYCEGLYFLEDLINLSLYFGDIKEVHNLYRLNILINRLNNIYIMIISYLKNHTSFRPSFLTWPTAPQQHHPKNTAKNN